MKEMHNRKSGALQHRMEFSNRLLYGGCEGTRRTAIKSLEMCDKGFGIRESVLESALCQIDLPVAHLLGSMTDTHEV